MSETYVYMNLVRMGRELADEPRNSANCSAIDEVGGLEAHL